ncbi:MAG: hypothetical protein IKL88_03865 [Erysipelotrichales bacterium]|nr:hypothetical protein [Erysipelotrichales bacterium]
MENKKWQRYVHYGVVRGEKEMRALWDLTCDVARSLWKDEFTLKDQYISRDEKERVQINLLYKFNVGFCEGCLFQNVLICMKLLDIGIDKSNIAKVLGIEESVVEEIASEKDVLSSIKY